MVDGHADVAAPRTVERLLAWLVARRFYALLLGAAFWLLMVGRVVTEGGRWTRGGLPVGWDFHVFYAAGTLIARGRAAELYEPTALRSALEQILPGDYPVFPFLNPPHFAALFAPLAALPRGLAFALFSLANVLLLFHALRLATRTLAPDGASAPAPFVAFGYALASYPVAVGLFAGQNCFVSLWLTVAASTLALRGRAFAAGCVAGALLYKPQLVLGFLVFFALYRPLRFRALAGFLVVLGLTLATNLFVSVGASQRYFWMLGELAEVHTRFRVALAFTGRAFFELLLPAGPRLAAFLGALLSAGCVVGYLLWARRERRVHVLLAGSIWLTLAVTPHASVYEWTLLVAALALVQRELAAREWTLAALVLFVSSYASPPLAEAMADRLGFGIQLAVPALLFAGVYAAKALHPGRGGALHAPPIESGASR